MARKHFILFVNWKPSELFVRKTSYRTSASCSTRPSHIPGCMETPWKVPKSSQPLRVPMTRDPGNVTSLQHHQTQIICELNLICSPLLCVGNCMEMIWSLRHAESLVIIQQENTVRDHLLCRWSWSPDDTVPAPLTDCARYHLMSSMLSSQNYIILSFHVPTN